eukprot:scaffold133472_cov40-Tisochrysis_lutea.AAC.1
MKIACGMRKHAQYQSLGGVRAATCIDVHGNAGDGVKHTEWVSTCVVTASSAKCGASSVCGARPPLAFT